MFEPKKRPARWRAAGTLLAALLSICSFAQAQVGRQFPSEKQVVVDRVTGRPLTLLTSGAFNDAKIYPTHPQWAADGVHILFRSADRSADGHPQIFVVNEISGGITQVSEGEGVDAGSINVARLSNKVYYSRRGGVDASVYLDRSGSHRLVGGAAHAREQVRKNGGHHAEGLHRRWWLHVGCR